MPALVNERELNRLYESLARYLWLRRRLSGARPGTELELHKKLRAPSGGTPGPGAGASGVNEWLKETVDLPDNPSVIDIGCGFGATVLAWATKTPGRFVGLSASPFQIRKARQQAAELGLEGRCRFREQDYDDPIPGRYDLAISIESLFHSPDLRRTLANIAASTKPGGAIALVEDMADGTVEADDPDLRVLTRVWHLVRLHTVESYRRALAASGFELVDVIDLTDQVDTGASSELDARERQLNLLARVTPFSGWRRVLGAFVGGIALERLYLRGRMRYLTMVAVRLESDHATQQ